MNAANRTPAAIAPAAGRDDRLRRPHRRPVRMYRGSPIAALLACAAAVQAHHSVALNFTDEEITLQGTITSLRWVNPHCTLANSA